MKGNSSNDELESISAKADEFLSELEGDANKRSGRLSSNGDIIDTAGHLVTLAISNSQRMNCQLESIEFTDSEIVLSAILYPNKEYASPVPFVIDKSTIKGWTGDGSAIQLVMPNEHDSVEISLRKTYATSVENKIVEIVKSLGEHNIQYIVEKDQQHRKVPARNKAHNLGLEASKEHHAIKNCQANIGPKPDYLPFFQSIRLGRPEEYWKMIYNNADAGMAIYEFGILAGICFSLTHIFASGEGYGYMFVSVVFSMVSYKACRRLYRKKATFNLSLVLALMSFSATPVGFVISRLNPQSASEIFGIIVAMFGICSFTAYAWSSSRRTIPKILMSILTANLATTFGALGFASIDIMPSSFYRKGIAYANADRLNDAKEALSSAIREQPDNPAFLLARGSLLIRTGDYENAASDLEKANKIGFDDKKKALEARKMEAFAIYRAQRYSKVCELSRRASSNEKPDWTEELFDNEFKDFVRSNCQ